MGWCHEFGCQIVATCRHPMTPGVKACTCSQCGAACAGRFGGCVDVWARGPRPVPAVERPAVTEAWGGNGHARPSPLRPEPGHVHAVAVAEEVVADMDFPSPPQPPPPPGPPPRRDPATEILAWMRREFDDVKVQVAGLSGRVADQETALTAAAGSQAAELNVTLAELEGCAAQLRNEAASLRDTRTALLEALPGLVAEAVGPAVTGTVERAVTGALAPAVTATVERAVVDLRLAVAELGAALAEALPSAVVDAVASDAAARAAPGPGDGTAEDGTVDGPPEAAAGTDLVSQLHQAQDEAAEWFSIVVDEAVRQAVERYLAPGVSQAFRPAVAPAGGAPPGPPPSPAPPDDPPSPSAGAPGGESLTGPGDAPHGDRPAVQPGAETSSVGELGSPPGPPPSAPAPPPAATGAEPTTVGDGTAATAGVQASAGPVVADDDVPAVDDDDGAWDSAVACVLPGAVVGPSLALGVSSALHLARLRRRRRRRAKAPAPGLFHDDPFAGEISRRLERFAVSRRALAFQPDGDNRGGGVLVVAGEHDGHEVAVDLAVSPLALVGAGAAAAGRALVATFLANTDPAAGRVIAVGGLLPSGPTFPGLDRADDLVVALDRLDAEIGRRASLADTIGGDPAGWRARNPDEPLPQLVLATPAPGGLTGRLADLLARGRSLGLTAVVVGGEVEGATTVDLRTGGTVRSMASNGGGTALQGSRLFTLGTTATAELLDLLAAARTDGDVDVAAELQEEHFPVLETPVPAPIQVRVLGDYRIEVGGQEIRSGLRAKARELLAFYLLHPEGTTLDVATEALWPEADPGRGSEWFWTALGNLRSLLRNATGTKQLKVIERDGDRYRIEPVFEVDLWRFQQALPPPGANTGDPEWVAALEAAAGLYGGELLSGVDWAWAEVPREDLRRRAVDVLVSVAATRLVAGDARGALEALSRGVDVDPLAEQLYRRIMRLHAGQSRPDEAEATFRRLEARLADLGLEPTPESRQLAEELRQAVDAPPRP